MIAMQAKQDWEKGLLVLNPQSKKGGKMRKIVYNMKEGRQEPLHLETFADETSSEESSETPSSEITSDDSDSPLEVMGVAISQPEAKENGTTDFQLESMLSKDLAQDEKDAYMGMLHCYSKIFIFNYDHITRFVVIQHHIHLKEGSKQIAKKL